MLAPLRCGASKGCIPGGQGTIPTHFEGRRCWGLWSFASFFCSETQRHFQGVDLKSCCSALLALLAEMQQPTDTGVCFVTGSSGNRDCWFSYEKRKKNWCYLLYSLLGLHPSLWRICTFIWGDAGTGELFWSFSIFKIYSFLMWFFFLKLGGKGRKTITAFQGRREGQWGFLVCSQVIN